MNGAKPKQAPHSTGARQQWENENCNRNLHGILQLKEEKEISDLDPAPGSQEENPEWETEGLLARAETGFLAGWAMENRTVAWTSSPCGNNEVA
jgi:hypothetical protein